MERGGSIGRDENGLGVSVGFPLTCLSEDAISHPIKPLLIQCFAAGLYKLGLSCDFVRRFNTRRSAADADRADYEA